MLVHFRVRGILILIIALMLSGQAVFGQEATAELTSEPIVATEVPTETPTLLPSPEATLEVTPEVPSEATVEVTLEVSAEATVVPTETPMATTAPVLPPEPSLTLVYGERFDTGNVADWSFPGDAWSLVASEEGQALQVFNSVESATLNIQNMLELFNIVVQARFELDNATIAQLGVRQNTTGGYTVTLDPTGQVTLLRAGVVIAAATTAPSQPDAVQWRVIRLSAIENVIRVHVDSLEVIAVQDAAPIPPGKVNVGASYTDSSVDHMLLVDDVAVWRPASDVPVIPATPTPVTPTATSLPPTPTETVSAPVLIDTGEARPLAVIPPVQSLDVRGAPPPNNTFSGALGVNTVIYTYTGSTTDATLETGELGVAGNLPNCAYRQYPANGLFYNYLVNTVWFSFTAPAAAEYNINTAGSKFDTVLGVYTGSSVSALTQLACHDGYTSSNGTSSLNIALTQGQTVYIQVGGFYGSKFGWFGAYTLQIKSNAPLPTKVTLLSPTNASYIDDLTPALAWNVATGALDYDLEIDDQSNFSSPAYTAYELAGTSHTVSTNLTPGLYYWRVRGENLNEQAPGWSSTFRFTVGILRSPMNGTVFTTDTSVLPTFRWYSTAGAVNYTLQIDTDSNFSSPLVLEKPGLTTNSYTLTVGEELETGTVYYWRVNPNGVPSPVQWSFKVSTAALPAPTITAPVEGLATSSLNYSVDWTDVTGATYDIQVDDTSNFSSPIANLTGLASSTYAFNAPANGLFYIRVRSVNALGVPGKWSATRRYTVDNVPPAPPMLNAPMDLGSTNDTTPTFSWKAVSGANKYQIQIDDSSNFSSVFEDEEVSGTSFTAPTLPNQGTWYWRVRSRDAAGNWSTAWNSRSFMLTMMRSPVNNTVLTISTTTPTTRPTFSWNSIVGATTYILQIDTSTAFNSPLTLEKTNLTTTSYALAQNEALPAGVYYWRVNTNLGVSPVYWTLRVSPAAPSAPSIAAPTQNLVIGSTSTQITWTTVTNAVTYHIQIDDTSNFSSPVIDTTGLGTALYNFNAPQDAVYYARVRGINNLGVAGKWSSTRRFTIDNLAPGVPALAAPKLESFTSSFRPRFTWLASSGANRYEIQLSLASNFTGSSTQTFIVTSASFTPANNLLYRTYYWHVRALDAGDNDSAWSETWTVTIAPATNIAPNLNRLATSTPTLRWVPLEDTTNYEIQVDDSSNFSSPVFTANLQTDQGVIPESVTLTPLPNGTYYWRMRVRDQNGIWSGWSTRQVFTIAVG
jgi:hypothetical protein